MVLYYNIYFSIKYLVLILLLICRYLHNIHIHVPIVSKIRLMFLNKGNYNVQKLKTLLIVKSGWFSF